MCMQVSVAVFAMNVWFSRSTFRREVRLALCFVWPINNQMTKAPKTACDFICGKDEIVTIRQRFFIKMHNDFNLNKQRKIKHQRLKRENLVWL